MKWHWSLNLVAVGHTCRAHFDRIVVPSPSLGAGSLGDPGVWGGIPCPSLGLLLEGALGGGGGSGYPKVGRNPNYVEDVLVLAIINKSPPARANERN